VKYATSLIKFLSQVWCSHRHEVSFCGPVAKVAALSGEWAPTFRRTHTASVFYPEDGGRIFV
jgi:hypothetical protein